MQACPINQRLCATKGAEIKIFAVPAVFAVVKRGNSE